MNSLPTKSSMALQAASIAISRLASCPVPEIPSQVFTSALSTYCVMSHLITYPLIGFTALFSTFLTF
jgi:hypothetical protein